MTKEQMKQAQEKIESLEKILMRDLDEDEINYLIEHSIEDFLYDILGFEEEDLQVLNRIRKIVSEYCTRPDNDHTSDDVEDFFKEDGEFEDTPIGMDFFKERDMKRKVSDVLSSIINELQLEKKAHTLIQPIEKPSSKPLDGCDEENEIEDSDIIRNLSEDEVVSIKDILPECAKKWCDVLSVDTIIKVYNETVTEYKRFTKYSPSAEYIDYFIGDVVDRIKDAAILRYVEILKKGPIEFNDEEIQSEVLDYLIKNKYKVKSINNKISL